MSDFFTVAEVGEIPAGEGRNYPVNGRMVAIFFVDGEYFAINDSCPHMGASLSAGFVEGHVVSCPWHAWRFCVKEGTWLDSPKSSLRSDCYELRIENGKIQVRVPDPAPRNPSTK